MATTLTGNNGKVTIGGSTKIVAAVKNYSVDIKADTIETSTMTTDTRTYVKGMSSWTGSADVLFSTENMATGDATYISQLMVTGGAVGDAPAAVEFYLDQVNYATKKFGGNAIITGFSVKSSMDGMVEASISFQGSGALTYTA